ncbi:ABC transporter ATP-binding protein [Natronoarchaeum sp. GCM10025703]|uniref:ABC transporter ATP-binding protein n=1 Tax=Natronoarchaeum sp. GCM10025703 TaxID=3252685 RepID=UPI003615CA70
MSELELVDITRSYGDTTALDDVSFRVEDGEFFTLVGPSGCGKTTTLRTVAGFESPDAGTVRIDGESVTGAPPEERDIGVVFQNYALFPHMTVAENVAYGLRFRDPPGDVSREERVTELLSLVDLDGFEERDPDELSGGQQQRIALARALAPGPELLLLDEPMSALDARLRKTLRRQLQTIQSELGVTTLYVTHDQDEALAISDRLAVINGGRIEQIGSPRDVYRRPDTRFVATFLGENNVFEGPVTDARASDGEYSLLSVSDTTLRIPRVDADRALVCVRPEALTVGGGVNELRADVGESEFLGGAVRIHLRWNGRDLVALDDRTPEHGSAVVSFDPSDVQVISTDAGRQRRIHRLDRSLLDPASTESDDCQLRLLSVIRHHAGKLLQGINRKRKY